MENSFEKNLYLRKIEKIRKRKSKSEIKVKI